MTTQSGLGLAKGVVVENMGSTVLVMVPGQHDVLTLTGPAADVVNAVVAGNSISEDLEPHTEHLIAAGVLTSPLSRRNLLRAGAIGAGASIAVLSMPSVAAASSPGGGSGDDDDDVPSFGISFSSTDPLPSFGVNDFRVTFPAGATAQITILSADSSFTRTYTSGAVFTGFNNRPAFDVTNIPLNDRPGLALFQPGSGATFTVVTNDGQTFVRVM